MTIEEKYKIYFEYRYLVEDILKNYPSDKYDIEELANSGICSLLNRIDKFDSNMKLLVIKDFETFVLFNSKSEIKDLIIVKSFGGHI